MTRGYVVLVLALLALTAVHVGFRAFAIASSSGPLFEEGSDAGAWAIDVDGEEAGASTLTEALGGTCGYVVVSAPWCGASAAVADDWGADLPEEILALQDAREWTVAWLILEKDAEGLPDAFDGLPMPIWSAVNTAPGPELFPVDVYPSHLIVDADGTVIRVGGGTRPQAEDLVGTECPLPGLFVSGTGDASAGAPRRGDSPRQDPG